MYQVGWAQRPSYLELSACLLCLFGEIFYRLVIRDSGISDLSTKYIQNHLLEVGYTLEVLHTFSIVYQS